VRTAELAGLTDIKLDPDLWEWDYGGYEGRTTPQIQQERPG
jgi:probable phosphoglycerate mutase